MDAPSELLFVGNSLNFTSIYRGPDSHALIIFSQAQNSLIEMEMAIHDTNTNQSENR